MKSNGFSLVELSIVLVILGLLVGGVLSGQSLIHAAELRSVTSDFDRYRTATYAFHDKYLGLPGDFKKATNFWGTDSTGCSSATSSGSGSGTCNGNGDSMFDLAASNGYTSEEFQFWRQLALAGLIEGTYTGMSGSAGLTTTVIGSNVPATRISGGGFSVIYQPTVSDDSDPNMFIGTYGNMIQAGSQNPGKRTGFPLFKPEDAWNIDTKLDDGKPNGGFIRGDKMGATNAPLCTDSNVSSSANYNLSITAIACRLTMDLQ